MTTSVDVAKDERQLVVFDLATELYGVDIGVVREIIRIQELTRIPETESYVEGVINLRGKVTPVIDLRKRLDLPVSEQDDDSRIVVVDVGSHDIGVIVDAVAEVLRISGGSIEPTSSVIMTTDSSYLLGIAKMDDRLIILLDLEQALSDEQITIDAKVVEAAPALEVSLLEESSNEIPPRGKKFVSLFYQKLFSLYPEVEPLFANTKMKKQKKKLLDSLVLVVDSLRKPDVMGPALKKLGEGHGEAGVRTGHYPKVGEALLETLAEYLGDGWTPELKSEWAEAYGAFVAGMSA